MTAGRQAAKILHNEYNLSIIDEKAKMLSKKYNKLIKVV